MTNELQKQALQVANDLVHAKILKKLYHITDNQKSIQTRLLHNMVCELHEELKQIALFITKISDNLPNQTCTQNHQEDQISKRERSILVAQIQDLKYQEASYQEHVNNLEKQIKELKDSLDELKCDHASLQEECDDISEERDGLESDIEDKDKTIALLKEEISAWFS